MFDLNLSDIIASLQTDLLLYYIDVRYAMIILKNE